MADGFVYPPYLNQTRTYDDFCEAIPKVVSLAPQDKWVFVCDGLNTHKSAALVRYVAQTCCPNMDLGIKGKTGILKNMESRMEFLHDESHQIRFVYTPKHSYWLNQIEIWFGIMNRKLLKRKSYI